MGRRIRPAASPPGPATAPAPAWSPAQGRWRPASGSACSGSCRRELAVERWELAQFPEEERRERELISEAKGLDAQAAAALAAQIMADPEVALDTLAREELGLNPGDLGSPWRAAVSSFLALAAGAVVPLLPFLCAAGSLALAASADVSALALAGATIPVLTGRPARRSALRMVAIGGGAAAVTYLIGSPVGVTLDCSRPKQPVKPPHCDTLDGPAVAVAARRSTPTTSTSRCRSCPPTAKPR